MNVPAPVGRYEQKRYSPFLYCQPLGANASAAPSEIGNSSSVNPAAGTADIRPPSAINPSAGASQIAASSHAQPSDPGHAPSSPATDFPGNAPPGLNPSRSGA